MVMYIKMEDPDLPAFYYDPLIHPIAFYKSDAPSGTDVLEDDEEDAFVLPEGACSPDPRCLACPASCAWEFI
jgi:pre-mRNA-processing factor 8